jgi:hypothetical protein
MKGVMREIAALGADMDQICHAFFLHQATQLAKPKRL